MIEQKPLNACPDGGHCWNEDRFEELTELAKELAAQIARLAVLCDEDELGEFYCCDLCEVKLASAIRFIHLDACLITRARRAGLLES